VPGTATETRTLETEFVAQAIHQWYVAVGAERMGNAVDMKRG
jgi:hypothetical protein